MVAKEAWCVDPGCVLVLVPLCFLLRHSLHAVVHGDMLTENDKRLEEEGRAR